MAKAQRIFIGNKMEELVEIQLPCRGCATATAYITQEQAQFLDSLEIPMLVAFFIMLPITIRQIRNDLKETNKNSKCGINTRE